MAAATLHMNWEPTAGALPVCFSSATLRHHWPPTSFPVDPRIGNTPKPVTLVGRYHCGTRLSILSMRVHLAYFWKFNMTENTGCTNAKGQAIRPAEHATRKAGPPFDTVDADALVRSGDRVDFFVHRVILSMGSAFYKIAQLQDAAPALVQVAEDSDTLDTFLRILYPLVNPEVDSPSHLRKILAAGVKYDAPSVVTSVRKALVEP